MILSLATLLLVGCGSKVFPTTTIRVADKPVLVELAVTPDQRARGLMHREKLAANDGMLFIYPDNSPRSFWMKDTKIPLSIAFIDSTGKIVKIAEMKPLTEKRTKSIYPAKYALEMNQGWFDANGVKKNDTVTGIPTDLDVQ